MPDNVKDILDAARARASQPDRDKRDERSEPLENLSATLQERIAPRLEAAGRDWRGGVSLQIHSHLEDGLETAGGPALSIRLIGGHTATGGDIGTDVFIISHPEPNKFEVRRLSSGKVINQEVGWPAEGTPTQAQVDGLLAVIAEEYFRTRQSFA